MSEEDRWAGRLSANKSAVGRKALETVLAVIYARDDQNTPDHAKASLVKVLFRFHHITNGKPRGTAVAAEVAEMNRKVAAHVKSEHWERAREWIKRGDADKA